MPLNQAQLVNPPESGRTGGVKAGTNITIAPDGTISASGAVGTITGVTAGTGLSGGGTSGNVTLNNTGVLSTAGGTGISVSSGTGNVTISNTGVTSLAGGDGVTVSSATGNVTVNFDIASLPALP